MQAITTEVLIRCLAFASLLALAHLLPRLVPSLLLAPERTYYGLWFIIVLGAFITLMVTPTLPAFTGTVLVGALGFFFAQRGVRRCYKLHEKARAWLAERACLPGGYSLGYGPFVIAGVMHISPRISRWDPASLDEPMRTVVLALEHEYPPNLSNSS